MTTTMRAAMLEGARRALAARIEWTEDDAASWADGACWRRYLDALRAATVYPSDPNGIACRVPRPFAYTAGEILDAAPTYAHPAAAALAYDGGMILARGAAYVLVWRDDARPAATVQRREPSALRPPDDTAAWRIIAGGCTLATQHTQRQAETWCRVWNAGGRRSDADMNARDVDPTGWRYSDGRPYQPERWDRTVITP